VPSPDTTATTASYLLPRQGSDRFAEPVHAATDSVHDAVYTLLGRRYVGTDHVFRLNHICVEAFSGIDADLLEEYRRKIYHGRQQRRRIAWDHKWERAGVHRRRRHRPRHSCCRHSQSPQVARPSTEIHKTTDASGSTLVTVNQNEAAIKRGIENDSAWVGRLLADSQDLAYAACSPAVWLCIEPYSSLIVHESHKKLKDSDPALAALVAGEFDEVVKRGRHSLKLFEDTGAHSGFRGIDGQIACFRDEIIPAHRKHFIDPVPRLARFWAKDLGMFTYNNKIIATTHAITFHFGLGAEEMLAKTGPDIATLTALYGAYFRQLGGTVPAAGATFLSRLDPASVHSGPDKVAANYYPSVFDGPGNPDLNALLTALQAMANFAAYTVSCTDAAGAVDYTEFKIRCIAVYQVLSSLRALHKDRAHTLTARSQGFLTAIVEGAEARQLLDAGTKPFRNTLMHYGIDSRVPAGALDLVDPLFGLAPVYFSSCADSGDLAKLVGKALTDTAAVLNDWSALN
jgi:hypothetical protein